MGLFILQFLAGYVYGLFAEWWIHKNLLHIHGKKKNDFLGFHFSIHHKNCRKNNNLDSNYSLSLYNRIAEGGAKEDLYLSTLLLLHIPTAFFAPGFFAAVLFSSIEYYYIHKRSHTSEEWAIKNVPWHYEHHMGKDQDANWGVRTNIVDKIFKTKTEYTSIFKKTIGEIS